MNESVWMIGSLLIGAFLGTLFFGGLWLTVRKAMTSKIPVLWVIGSFISRIGIVMSGFYVIIQRSDWRYGLLFLLGFMAARFLVIRLTTAHESKRMLIIAHAKEVSRET